MLEAGYKISDLNSIPLTGKECAWPGRIAIDNTHFLSYAQTVYGTRYNKQNYKVPLSALRNDIKGYIGVESVNAPWAGSIRFWAGLWEDDARPNKSYIKEWGESDKLHPHYNPDKFSDTNIENSYFIIDDQPFPFELENHNNRVDRGEKEGKIDKATGTHLSINVPLKAADPRPDSKKIVTKQYVDERLASKRLIEVGADFWVRDYDCVYVIRPDEIKNASSIKIRYPEEFAKRAQHNRLEFTVLVEGVKKGNEWISAAPNKNIPWRIYNADSDTPLTTSPLWLSNNSDEISATIIGDNNLYKNAQYLLIRFQTVTHEIKDSVIKDAESIDNESFDKLIVTPEFSVYMMCENILYKRNGFTLELVGKGNVSVTPISSSSSYAKFEIDVADMVLVSNKGTIAITPTDNGYSLDLSSPLVKVESTDKSLIVTPSTDNNTGEKVYNLSLSHPLTNIACIDGSISVNKTNDSRGWNISTNIPEVKQINLTGKGAVTCTKTSTDADSNIAWDIKAPTILINGSNGIAITSTNSSTNLTKTFTVTNAIKTLSNAATNTIDFSKSNIEYYILASGNISINYTTALLGTSDIPSIILYVKTTADIEITNNDIQWAMSKDNTRPILRKNRLYQISLTRLPAVLSGNSQIVAVINWFKYN